MRDGEMKKRYPLIWDTVEQGVRDDVRVCLVAGPKGRTRRAPSDEDISRIAHNAAFLACLARDTEARKSKRGAR